MRRKRGRPIKNLEGKQFGCWDVLSLSYVNNKGAYWSCMCKLCERVFDIRSDSLQSGGSTKCKRCAISIARYGHAGII